MALWIIATLCAFFVKGLCGFANTLVFTSILSFGTSNVNISPVELILCYPTNIILAAKERKSIRWKTCLPLILFVILGSIPGALFLKNADTTIVRRVLGIIIALIGLEMLVRELRPRKYKASGIAQIVIGLLSGVLCGIYGIGALLGAYLSRVTKDSSSFKANICVVFFVDNTFRLILYSLYGIITPAVLLQAAPLLPLMLLGLILGMVSSKFLNEKNVKLIVILLLIISGIALSF